MNGKQLKNSILQWAIQGKLVPQDPNDEPASVLLERIRAEKERLIKAKEIKRDKNESIIYRGEDNSYYEKFANGTVKCIDDEIPFEIPISWEWCRFDQIVNHSPSVECTEDCDVAFMPMKYIEAGYGSKYSYETKNWNYVKTGFTKMNTGDIAYAKITPCFQNRKSFILGDVPNRIATATTELNVIRIYGNTIEPWYILFILKSEYFIREAKYKGTAGQQRVLSDYVKTKLIPLPPKEEQERITIKRQELLPSIEKYSKAQESLDKLNAEIKERLKKSILQEAIQGKLVPQDPNDEPASVLLERIRAEKERLIKAKKIKRDKNESVIYKGDDNSYYEKFANGTENCIDDEIPFEIPQSWEWVRIGYLFQHNTGKALNGKGKGTPQKYITTSNLYWNHFDLSIIKEMNFSDEELEKYTVRKGDLLVCEGGDIGRAAIWNFEYNICIQNHIHRLRSYSSLEVEYFYYLFYFYNRTGKIGGKGIGIQGLSSGALHNILVPCPPITEQQRIVVKIEELFAKLQ